MNKWEKRRKYDTCESTIELDRISMFLAVTREIKKWNCGQTLWHITISSIQPTGISIDTTIHKMTHFMALLQLNFVFASSYFSMKKKREKNGSMFVNCDRFNLNHSSGCGWTMKKNLLINWQLKEPGGTKKFMMY